jgi:hypothetical protein
MIKLLRLSIFDLVNSFRAIVTTINLATQAGLRPQLNIRAIRVGCGSGWK